MLYQFVRLSADVFSFCACPFSKNHFSYARPKKSVPFVFRFHAIVTIFNSNLCVVMGGPSLLFHIIIISRHKPAFLRQKIPYTISRLPVARIPSVWILARIPKLAWNLLISTLLPTWIWQLLPSTRRRRTRSCRRRRCRTRHNGTATPGTNLRWRAERRPLSTLGPTDHARRPRTETRAAGSPACGNVGGAFVAAGVTAVAQSTGPVTIHTSYYHNKIRTSFPYSYTRYN